MNPIKVMVNGIPGNIAQVVAKHVLTDNRFELIPYSLTGPEITISELSIGSSAIQLIRPEQRGKKMSELIEKQISFISIDFTHPTAVNGNAEFYCKNLLPFVMGTTGGDRKLLEETVNSSSIAAVIAPNMAKQIVGFQAMMEYASKTFPDLFKGYSLSIKESHRSEYGQTDCRVPGHDGVCIKNISGSFQRILTFNQGKPPKRKSGYKRHSQSNDRIF
ncbi:MAG: hypothetical protein JRI92_09335 [Deltaproteobacteria bacterium]|nr:hypothetical protein [Deltaproteobacteria bacterium]